MITSYEVHECPEIQLQQGRTQNVAHNHILIKGLEMHSNAANRG